MSTPLMDIATDAANQLTSVQTDCEFLALQWTIEQFVATMYSRKVEMAVACLNALREGNHTKRKTVFIYNDLDCNAWSGAQTWFAHQCQNHLMLYFLTPSHDIVDGKLVEVTTLTVYKCDDSKHLKELVSKGGSKYRDLRDPEYLGSSKVDTSNGVAMDKAYLVRAAIFNIETLHCAIVDGDD